MSDKLGSDVNSPPSLFYNVDESFIDISGYSVAVEKCPICRIGERKLNCAQCASKRDLTVNSSQFSTSHILDTQYLSQHRSLTPWDRSSDLKSSANRASKLTDHSLQHPYSLSEGCNRLKELHIIKRELALKIDSKMMTEYAQDDKKLKIEKLRERLKSLRLKLDQQIATRIEKLSESKVICRENRKLARFIASSKKKCLSKVSEVQKRKEALLVRQQEIDEMEKDSLARRQRVVKDMGEFMFPVEPVRALSQSNDNLDSVSMELQDASNHQYVKGAWAYVDTAKDFQYTIAGARFYASGECVELRQYLDYTPEQKIASKPTSAHGEWAALSHISQFVQSMAASLDVHVPYMTYIPLLNLGSATSEDLTNFLAQINMNLAVLSASQGIDMHDYFPRRTISNLYHLLNRDYLSRSQQHQLVLTSQIQTVHDDITRPLLYEPLPGEQPEDSNYVIVTESPIIRSSEMISTSYAASASSIMTSAVSAVSSLWPWK